MEYNKQVEKLMEELKDKTDSESFDDEKEKLLNVKKAMQLDTLKEEVKNLELELKQLRADSNSNIARLQSNLEYTRLANQGLKQDYDALQEKFDKNLKASNNINAELKEDVDKLMDKNSKLQILVDDSAEEVANIKAQKDKETEQELQEKETEI